MHVLAAGAEGLHRRLAGGWTETVARDDRPRVRRAQPDLKLAWYETRGS